MNPLPSLSLDTNALANLYSPLEPTSNKGWNYSSDGQQNAYFISQGSEYMLQKPVTTPFTTLNPSQISLIQAGISALVSALDTLPTPPTAITNELESWATSLNTSTTVSGMEVDTLVTHIRNNQGDDKATLKLGYLYCPPIQGPLLVYLDLNVDWAGTLASLNAGIHLLSAANFAKTVAKLAAELAEITVEVAEWVPPAMAFMSVATVSLAVADVVVKQILNAASDGGQLNLIGVLAHAIQNISSCMGPWSGVTQPTDLALLNVDGLGYTWTTNQGTSSIIQDPDLTYTYQTAIFPVTSTTYPPLSNNPWMVGGNQLLNYGYNMAAQYVVGLPELSWSSPGGGLLMTSKVEITNAVNGNTYALSLMYFTPKGKLLRVSAYVSSGSTGAGIVGPTENSYDSSYLDFDVKDDTAPGDYYCCLLSGVIGGEVASQWERMNTPVLQLVYIVPLYMSACVANVALPQPTAAPVVTWISPTQGLQGQAVSVTLYGTFAPGATCDFGPGITVGSNGMNLGSSLTVVATIAADAPLGFHDVIVTNPGNGSNPDGASTTFPGGFFVRAPGQTLRPHIDTLTPDSSTVGDSLTVTIAGSGFVQGSTLDFGPTIEIKECAWLDANTMTAAITIPAGTPPGAIQVQVTDPHQEKHPTSASFTVLGLSIEAYGLHPDFGAPGLQMSLTLGGANFQPGATCAFESGSGIEVGSCTAIASHESHLLSIDITIPSDAKSGLRGAHTLTVTNPDQQSATTSFHLREKGTPIVTHVSPPTGKPGDELTLTITGYGFTAPIQCEFVDIDLRTDQLITSGITVNACTVTNANEITIAISIAPDANPGLRELFLITSMHRIGMRGFLVAQDSAA